MKIMSRKMNRISNILHTHTHTHTHTGIILNNRKDNKENNIIKNKNIES